MNDTRRHSQTTVSAVHTTRCRVCFLFFLPRDRMENSSFNLTGCQLCDTQANLLEKTTLLEKLVKVIPLIIIIFTSMIGNALVVRFVFSDRRTLTVINILILSQTFADIGATVLVIPFAAVSVVEDRWVFGHVMCTVNGFFNMYFTVITLLNLSLISLDRYYSVVKASHYMTQQKSAIWTLICMWSVTLLFTFPWLPFLSNKVVMGYFPGFYICGQRFLNPDAKAESGFFVSTCLIIILFPLLVIIYSFHKITKHIQGKRKRISPTILSTAQKLSMDAYAKSAYTSLMVNVTSLIQVFPACILMAVDGLQIVEIPYRLETFLKWIMWCHCVIKPMIYAARKGNSQNLQTHNKFINILNFVNPCSRFLKSKQQKERQISRFCSVKYNARTPSVVFGSKNIFFQIRKDGRKGKYLKKAWSFDNDVSRIY